MSAPHAVLLQILSVPLSCLLNNGSHFYSRPLLAQGNNIIRLAKLWETFSANICHFDSTTDQWQLCYTLAANDLTANWEEEDWYSLTWKPTQHRLAEPTLHYFQLKGTQFKKGTWECIKNKRLFNITKQMCYSTKKKRSNAPTLMKQHSVSQRRLPKLRMMWVFVCLYSHTSSFSHMAYFFSVSLHLTFDPFLWALL